MLQGLVGDLQFGLQSIQKNPFFRWHNQLPVVPQSTPQHSAIE